MQKTQITEIRVLRDNDTVVLTCIVPDILVRRTLKTDSGDVHSIYVQIVEANG